MKESDKKKIGEAYLRLHSDDKKKPMTPEEAIKELREASDSEVRYGDTEHHYDEVMKRVEALALAIKALEQQQYIHDTCKKCIEFSEFIQTGWIPVSERLPEVYEFVNCTCHSLIDDREDWVIETVYIPQPSDSPYSDWGNIPMLNGGDCKVVAWMHRDIPEPYKAESEDKV